MVCGGFWWVVGGGHFYHGRVGSIFNVWGDFSYPRDANFCDEYASKGLVLITLLWEEEDWSVADTLSWFLSERIVICELSGLFLASAFFWLI